MQDDGSPSQTQSRTPGAYFGEHRSERELLRNLAEQSARISRKSAELAPAPVAGFLRELAEPCDDPSRRRNRGAAIECSMQGQFRALEGCEFRAANLSLSAIRYCEQFDLYGDPADLVKAAELLGSLRCLVDGESYFRMLAAKNGGKGKANKAAARARLVRQWFEEWNCGGWPFHGARGTRSPLEEFDILAREKIKNFPDPYIAGRISLRTVADYRTGRAGKPK